jgi:hypothetical protein
MHDADDNFAFDEGGIDSTDLALAPHQSILLLGPPSNRLT